MRRVFLVAMLIGTLVITGYLSHPATTSALQSMATAEKTGTTIADPRVDPNAALHDAVLFATTNPPVAGPLQDTKELLPNKPQYVPSGVLLGNAFAQYSFVVPATDGWMLGFTFWDDGQGNSHDISIISSSGSVYGALGHSMANQWLDEQEFDAGDSQSLGFTPGAPSTLTLLVYNGVAILAANSTQILGQVDIGMTGTGDIAAKMGGAPEPSMIVSISDFSVWDLSVMQSTAPPVGPLPVTGQATSPLLPPIQGTSALGKVFDRTRHAAIGNPPLAAEFYGFMTQTDGKNYVVNGVKANASDFYTIITVTNPEDDSVPIDFGIGFRSLMGSSPGYMVFVRSDGPWYFERSYQNAKPSFQGVATSLDRAPGASNTIELMVQGGTATVAINGVVQGSLDVGIATEPGRVSIYTSYLPSTSVEGRRVSFQDWWLFPLSE